MNIKFLIAAAALAISSAATADAYKCLGPDNKPYFTDQPCRQVITSNGSGDLDEDRRRASARGSEIAVVMGRIARIKQEQERERQEYLRQKQVAAAAQQAAYERQAEAQRQQDLIDEVRQLRVQQAAQAAQPQPRRSFEPEPMNCYQHGKFMHCN